MTLTPREIVDKMFANDDFSQWLGITFIEVSPGYCKLKMTVRKEMTNGFDISHGGISFSFADSAFAFASNSRGRHAVSIETSISHTRPIKAGDVLIAEATETNLSDKLGHYDVEVVNQDKKIVAIFKGTVFRKNIEWE